MTVQDTMATRNSHEIVLQDTRAAKRRGEARMGDLPQLADFGDKAWPRDPVQAIRMSFPHLRDMLIELEWRLVDHVAIQVQGGTACMISVPMLHPLPGHTSPDYSTDSAVPGAPLLQLRKRLRLAHRRCPQLLSSACGQCTRPSGHQRQGSLPS